MTNTLKALPTLDARRLPCSRSRRGPCAVLILRRPATATAPFAGTAHTVAALWLRRNADRRRTGADSAPNGALRTACRGRHAYSATRRPVLLSGLSSGAAWVKGGSSAFNVSPGSITTWSQTGHGPQPRAVRPAPPSGTSGRVAQIRKEWLWHGTAPPRAGAHTLGPRCRSAWRQRGSVAHTGRPHPPNSPPHSRSVSSQRSWQAAQSPPQVSTCSPPLSRRSPTARAR